MLNWRDLSHPAAGGAELLTMRVLERLARRGWDVEWFSGAYDGCVRHEVADGITFVRAGSQMTVHVEAYLRYRKQRGRFDVIVDQINTIPFYAARYMDAPVIAFFHQLAQEVWIYEKGPLIGRGGAALEPLYLRPYRDRPVITVSPSSAQSLRSIGFRGPIRLLDEAVDEPCDAAPSEKSPSRDVVIIGRLTPSKRIDHAIRAARIMCDRGWRGRLFVIGGGTNRRHAAMLRRLAAQLLPGRCEFVDPRASGKVGSTTSTRTALLRSCSATWYTSVREGWGMVVTEANCHGTPAVVYRVPGVIDAVKDGVTGLVCDPNPSALAAATLQLFGPEYPRFAEAALRDAAWRNWDRTTTEFETALCELAALPYAASREGRTIS